MKYYLLSTRAKKLYMKNIIVIFNIIDIVTLEKTRIMFCEKNIKFIIINILLFNV